MRNLLGLLLLISAPVNAQINSAEISARSQQSINKTHQIKLCTKIQNNYGQWAHARRVALEAGSTDNPNGIIDASLVTDSYYIFSDAFSLVRERIEAIQRSSNPDARNCQVISDNAKDRIRNYLEGLISQ